jgi:hypothetical protein
MAAITLEVDVYVTHMAVNFREEIGDIRASPVASLKKRPA